VPSLRRGPASMVMAWAGQIASHSLQAMQRSSSASGRYCCKSPKLPAVQTEGSIVYALGSVLREKITIKDGRVRQSNYSDYEVARMWDVPNIEIKIVSTANKPTGGGEEGVPLVACAVGNATIAQGARRTGSRARTRTRRR
jgi:CO/xanthine dehydrogenase Mo-binding subunit